MSIWIMLVNYVKLGIISWLVWFVVTIVIATITCLKCPEEYESWLAQYREGEGFKWSKWDTIESIIWPFGILWNTVSFTAIMYDIIEAHRENKKYFQEN